MPAVTHRQQPVIVSNSPISNSYVEMVDVRSTSISQSAHPASGLNSDAAAHLPVAPAVTSKKAKAKKHHDPVDTNKLLEQTVARLERNIAGDREQELEIEREVKKANRELSSSIATLDNPIARIDALQEKYKQLFRDMKRLEQEHKNSKRRGDQLQKERDTAKSELNKVTTMKDKLEKLSRETSNENRRLRAELQRCQEDEAKKREELHDRLDKMVVDVEDVVLSKEQSKEHSEMIETDDLFRQKFKSLLDQYEMRELHYQSLTRVKDIEIQRHAAKLEQQRKAQEIESSKSHQLTRQVCTFSQTETELRSQLNIYVEKFKQVEDTLNSSNDLFLTFRKEMEEMSKKTRRLENENQTLTRKQEATNQNILKMAEERTKTAKELELLRKKNENLEKLCRGMQAQGRGQAPLPGPEVDEERTESEYDDYEDEESIDGEYDDDSEEPIEAPKRPFGPVPPPPPPKHTLSNGSSSVSSGTKTRRVIGQANGIKA